MRIVGPFVLFFLFLTAGFCVDLSLSPEDLHMEWDKSGGYHLYINKKGTISSVLITESTADPHKESAVYALRSSEYNPINGEEKRMLNGEFLEPSKDLYSLIDSTPGPYPKFGEAFHIFIPDTVKYGYEDKRHGEITVYAGTYLNIRTFERPYADYRGSFRDNPFIVSYVQRRPEPEPEPVVPEVLEPSVPEPDARYNKETVDNFREIAEEGKGTAFLSEGYDAMLDEIGMIVDTAEGNSLDLVLALDTTQSMTDDIPYLRRSLVPLLKDHTKGFDRFRIGIVLYRDYMEQYLTKIFPFQGSLAEVQRVLNSIHVRGGRDIPEAVYEALAAGIHEFPWSAEARKIILVGDAPAHPHPRGKVTKEMVYSDADTYGIELYTIILPH
jgi:hypothetical protein